jgi:hypothetical protein
MKTGFRASLPCHVVRTDAVGNLHRTVVPRCRALRQPTTSQMCSVPNHIRPGVLRGCAHIGPGVVVETRVERLGRRGPSFGPLTSALRILASASRVPVSAFTLPPCPSYVPGQMERAHGGRLPSTARRTQSRTRRPYRCQPHEGSADPHEQTPDTGVRRRISFIEGSAQTMSRRVRKPHLTDVAAAESTADQFEVSPADAA